MNTKHSKSPSLHKCGVTRGWLPQRAGLPGLNGGGASSRYPRWEKLQMFKYAHTHIYCAWQKYYLHLFIILYIRTWHLLTKLYS